MAYRGLCEFVSDLERNGELCRISAPVTTELEITEITDRVSKSNGKALLFENNGTNFPVLINAFGSSKRLSMALGGDVDDIAKEVNDIADSLTGGAGLFNKMGRLLNAKPIKRRGAGRCQEVVCREPDLSILPILKCWPMDGGRFVTLPMVHTYHPITKKTNVGMYRMQVLDAKTTALHWQRHKTGANHYEAWRCQGGKMPVSVALGGDPSYIYSATAPLPEGIDEYMLAGFLRGRMVKMVKCITNDIYVPADCDIVIEGYVDTAEELVWEGPFGDHTGFYSLPDWYPKFHVTCITYANNAVYPATVVGIPPMEDAWLAKATEKIFFTPIKLAIIPEIIDMHLPDVGVAHNLAVIKINKRYPGQGKKVLSSIFGAGQMMFTKYAIVVSEEIDIRDYAQLARCVFSNVNYQTDLIFTSGPLDVLDHTCDMEAMGGKLGVDATKKLDGERTESIPHGDEGMNHGVETLERTGGETHVMRDYQVVIASVNGSDGLREVKQLFSSNHFYNRLVIIVDSLCDVYDLPMVIWLTLGNSDPSRDILLSGNGCCIDGTTKIITNADFKRRWPNVVVSSSETINMVNERWQSYGLGEIITSPSIKYRKLYRDNVSDAEVKVNNG